MSRMFGVVDTALETVTILSADAERIYPELSPSLVGARRAAALREYAGRLGSQLTTPIGAQAALGTHEQREIPVLIGRIEQLKQLIEVTSRAHATDTRIKQGIVEMNSRYFANGIPLINRLTLAGSTGPEYGMGLAEFVEQYVPEMASIVKLRDIMFDVAREGASESLARARRNLGINTLIGLLVLAIEIAVFLLIRRRVLMPLLACTSSVVAIAEGRLDARVPVTRRGDEIGDMQRAVAALKQTSLEKQRLEAERVELIGRLQHHSSMDFLTNLLNRRAFNERVTQQLAIARRNHWPVSLIMFDLDHFKLVNDRHGHGVGDTVLAGVADIARKEFRATDTLARHGGEEFIAMLVNCGEDDAVSFADRVRIAIADASFNAENGETFQITASFGVGSAQAEDVTDFDAFSHRADLALYRAKHDGRNRVVRSSTI